jgi:hypothetical protein
MNTFSLPRNFAHILSKIAVRSRVSIICPDMIVLPLQYGTCRCLHSHEAVVVLGRNDTPAGRRAMGAGCQEAKDADAVQASYL